MNSTLTDAVNQLNKVLEAQPNLLSYAGLAADGRHGRQAAEFCIQFIETYSAWLQKNP